MATSAKNESGDWTRYRTLPELVEVDFHWSEEGPRQESYYEAMEDVYDVALDSLKTAFENGRRYVLFRHGHSTSRPGQTTARSVVRGLMRSKEATPYIIRSQCIQHYAVFVAAIRPNPEGAKAFEEQEKAALVECEREIQHLATRYLRLAAMSGNSHFRIKTQEYVKRLVEAGVDRQSVRDKLFDGVHSHTYALAGRYGAFETLTSNTPQDRQTMERYLRSAAIHTIDERQAGNDPTCFVSPKWADEEGFRTEAAHATESRSGHDEERSER